MKMVGKPDAGNPLVRFEEGGRAAGPSLLYRGEFTPGGVVRGALS